MAFPSQTDLELLVALDATMEDLEANREGYLTKRQRYLIRSQSKDKWISILLLGTFIVSIIFFGFYTQDMQLIRIAMAALLLLVLCWLFIRFYNQARSTDPDLSKGLVKTLEGEITLFKDNVRGETQYFVLVNLMQCRVTKSTFMALQDSNKYRIYYLPNTNHIVSMESIDKL